MIALFLGIMAEAKSRRPDLDGEGRLLAWLNIGVGLAGLLWSMLWQL